MSGMLSFVSLLIGLASLLTWWIPGLGAIISAAAIVFAIIALVKEGKNWQPIVGLSSGAVSLGVAVVFTVILLQGIETDVDPEVYEETFDEVYEEPKVDEPTPADVPADKPTEIETISTGGTSEEWVRKVLADTGGGTQFNTVLECDEAMIKQVNLCTSDEGWMVDNAMEIVDHDTNYRFEYQEIQRGGCEQDVSGTTTVSSDFKDSDSEKFLVLCSINCYQWECPDSKPEKTEWTIKITGTGYYNDRQTGIDYDNSGEFTIKRTGSSVSGSGSGDADIAQEYAGCTGSGSLSRSFSVEGTISGDSATITLSESSPRSYMLDFGCGSLEITSEIESPFNFEGEDVTINLDGSTSVSTSISGEHGRTFEWTFEVIG